MKPDIAGGYHYDPFCLYLLFFSVHAIVFVHIIIFNNVCFQFLPTMILIIFFDFIYVNAFLFFHVGYFVE